MSFQPTAIICGRGLPNLLNIYIKRQAINGKYPVYNDVRLSTDCSDWLIDVDVNKVEWLPIQLELQFT